MHKPLIIFDFDGTLVNSSPGLMHALQILAKRDGYAMKPREEIEAVISLGSAAILSCLTGMETTNAKMPGLQKDFFAIYQRHGIFENQLYPGMQQVLDALADSGFTCAIMSNGRSPVIGAMLSHLKIADYFASMVCADQIKNRKPAPEGLLKVCQEVSRSPEQGIYIGDAVTDIRAGQAAGMKTVAALYGYVPADNPADTWGADYMIEKPLELLPLLGL